MNSRAAQSLFAYLVLNAGTAFRREKLAGQLWPDATEESARDYLRHALWRIRKALHAASATSCLKADDLTIAFDNSRDCWVDVAALMALDGKSSADEIAEAVDAYTGELLPGFYDEWVLLEREHLHSIYEQQVSRLLNTLQQQGRWADVSRIAESWIALGQRPEAAFRCLMLASAAQADMAKMTAAYERCAKSLSQLGIEPSEQTRSLYAELKNGKKIAESPAQAPQVTSQREPVSKLPAPLTTFIGREKELAEIVELLKSRRLLTLLGPGGVGKTRLAIAAADREVDSFRHGVWWVDLVGLSDPSLVPQAVAQVCAAQDLAGKSTLDSLIEHFAARQSLIVLDNCEHLIGACAHLADRLLSNCPGVRILATSREALDILGETTWTVPSLTLPSAGRAASAKDVLSTESGRLFIERVTSGGAHFVLTERNASTVASICNRLDGIPLAIELAAARVKMMSVDEINQRLGESLDLLRGGNRSALPRHQTLRATIDWSHELLSGPERILFRRLASFADGFTLEAVESVTSDNLVPKSQVVDLLGHLLSKSLVSAWSGLAESVSRYRMLETIRQYAREKLEAAQELDALRQRHLAFFALFALRAQQGIYSSEQAHWFQLLDNEADNLRVALDWSPLPGTPVQEPEASAVRKRFTIISALAMYWESAYRREITHVATRLLELDRANTPTIERAKALNATAFLSWSLHDFSLAKNLLEESIEIADGLGDTLTLAWALGYLGWTYDSLGEYETANGLLERSLALARSHGKSGDQAAVSAMSFLGDMPYWRGDLPEARRLYEEVIAFAAELHNINTMTYPLRRLGYVALRQGNPVEAARRFRQSLQYNQQLRHVPGMTACIVGFAVISLVEDDTETAAVLCGCVEGLLERFGAPFFAGDQVEFERAVSMLKAHMPSEYFEAAWAAGRSMQLEQAIAFVLQAGPGSTLPFRRGQPQRRNTQRTRQKTRIARR